MRLATPTQDLAEKYGLPENAHGAVVTSVQPRSPADRAGLQPGDVITQVDRKPAGSAEEVSNLISKHPGKTPILLYVESGANGGHIVAVEPKK
jgi:serine protease Do